MERAVGHFANINSKMASGRWLAKVLGNYKRREGGAASINARIYARPVHAMLSLIYIVALFPLDRLFSDLSAALLLFPTAMGTWRTLNSILLTFVTIATASKLHFYSLFTKSPASNKRTFECNE